MYSSIFFRAEAPTALEKKLLSSFQLIGTRKTISKVPLKLIQRFFEEEKPDLETFFDQKIGWASDETFSNPIFWKYSLSSQSFDVKLIFRWKLLLLLRNNRRTKLNDWILKRSKEPLIEEAFVCQWGRWGGGGEAETERHTVKNRSDQHTVKKVNQ